MAGPPNRVVLGTAGRRGRRAGPTHRPPLPGPPGTGYHRLGVDQYRWVFDELIAPTYLDRALRRAPAHTDPVVVYLLGKPGAGQMMASRMLRQVMRPGTVQLDPDDLRGSHPDSFDLVNTESRLADEAWQAEAEAYVRERCGSLAIEADFTSACDFRLSTRRFARAGYRIEVVVLACRETDTRQATLVRHARALELDVITALPTPAAHARFCRTVGDITVAANSDPDIAAVLVLDAEWRVPLQVRRPWHWAHADPGRVTQLVLDGPVNDQDGRPGRRYRRTARVPE
ncbi:zeta toxin family protein [Streptomyces sp. NPDC091371]|uniref:zeta toxin family protein n=1 Tax=Streptomyces sp. NPDC091371 TaxID=3155303 RepID=UPI003414D7B2